MGNAQSTYPRGLDFEQVWAALMENREQLKETEKLVKEIAESQKETDRLMKEAKKEAERQKKETDREMKEYNKRFGDFSNRFGEVVEYMIVPGLLEKFREMGFKFLMANRNREVSDHANNLVFEVDVILENGEIAMIVEVKTKLTIEYVKDHIKRLEKMRAYADLHGDKRKFLGAVAGVVITPNARNYALAQGFYVIEPSGESFLITPPPGQPKEW